SVREVTFGCWAHANRRAVGTEQLHIAPLQMRCVHRGCEWAESTLVAKETRRCSSTRLQARLVLRTLLGQVDMQRQLAVVGPRRHWADRGWVHCTDAVDRGADPGEGPAFERTYALGPGADVAVTEAPLHSLELAIEAAL